LRGDGFADGASGASDERDFSGEVEDFHLWVCA
jgi:hypothetical protein